MSQNLGSILEAAGIRGSKVGKSSVTIEDLKGLRVNTPEIHDPLAMKKLPPEFAGLGTEKTGKNFLSSLRTLLENVPADDVDEHLVFGVIQLAHLLRDQSSGSKRTSFKIIIPTLLEAKKKVLKGGRSNPRDILLRAIPEE